MSEILENTRSNAHSLHTVAAATLSIMEPPFSKKHQLTNEDNDYRPSSNVTAQTLPDGPRVLSPDCLDMLDLLEREFFSTDLDRLAPKLWWMSKQDSTSISPLHRQKVKQRNIIVTEDPKLHLVWIHNRVFIKPLPLYIGSFAFWRHHLGDEKKANIQTRQSCIRKAILGYLRSYIYLIQHKSDFRIAQSPELCLIPADITWGQFCGFASDLAQITDMDVSKRYHFGEIRLTRLNFYAPLLLHKSHFQRVEYQYGTYFSQYYAPVLFIIGVTSVILSGLQVALAADQGSLEGASELLLAVAFWLSVVMILSFCAVVMYLCILWLCKIMKELRFALQDRQRLLEEGRLKAM